MGTIDTLNSSSSSSAASELFSSCPSPLVIRIGSPSSSSTSTSTPLHSSTSLVTMTHSYGEIEILRDDSIVNNNSVVQELSLDTSDLCFLTKINNCAPSAKIETENEEEEGDKAPELLIPNSIAEEDLLHRTVASEIEEVLGNCCLLYTSPSPRDS